MDTATDEVSTEELRRDIASQREDIGRDLEAIGDRLSPGRMADRSKERTRRRVMTWRDKVMGVAGDARSKMGDTAHMMGEAAPSTDASPSEMVTEKVEGSPLVAGMVAFGLGFLAGSILPASRKEQEMARSIEPQVQHLAQEAADTARNAGEHLAPVVKEEVEAVKGEASDAASEVAGAAKSEMSSARDDVKKDVKS